MIKSVFGLAHHECTIHKSMTNSSSKCLKYHLVNNTDPSIGCCHPFKYLPMHDNGSRRSNNINMP